MANDVKQVQGSLTKDEVKEFVQEAVKAAVVAGIAMNAPAPAKVPEAAQFVGECQTCHQKLLACRGKHRMAVVYPKNPRYASPQRGGWVGVVVNGVTYRSNDAFHQIPVPADSCPENLVATWEETEDTMSQGRTGGGHLAQVGKSQSFVNPFAGQQAWR